MTTSQRSAAEDALLALMTTDPTLSVIEGTPQLFEPADPKQEHIWISEDSDLLQSPSLTGAEAPEMHEEFTIEVIVFLAKTGDHYAELRDRGDVLVAAIEQLVRDNPTLGATVFSAFISAIDRRSAGWETRRALVFAVRLAVNSYIAGA